MRMEEKEQADLYPIIRVKEEIGSRKERQFAKGQLMLGHVQGESPMQQLTWLGGLEPGREQTC